MRNDSAGIVSFAILVSGLAVGSEYFMPKKEEPFVNKANPMANGYDVEMRGYGLIIGRYDFEKKRFLEDKGIIHARDSDKNGRIDSIRLENVAKGSDLEKLANIETLCNITNGLLTAKKVSRKP